MYLPHDSEPDIIYVFATKAGNPRIRTGTTTWPPPVAAVRDAGPKHTW
jgi:hypothetical protein